MIRKKQEKKNFKNFIRQKNEQKQIEKYKAVGRPSVVLCSTARWSEKENGEKNTVFFLNLEKGILFNALNIQLMYELFSDQRQLLKEDNKM